MALPPDPAAWPASPVAGALLRRVPGLWRCGGTGSDGVTLPPPRQPRPPPAQHHPGWEESHAVLLDAVFLPALRAGRLCGAPACRDDDDDDRAAAGSGDAVPPRPVRRLYERVFGAAEAADRARRTARAAAKAARRGCEAEAAAAASAPLAGGATLLLPRPRLLLAGPLAAGAPPAFAGVGLLPRPLPPAPDAAAAGAAASAYAAPVQQTQTQTQTQSQKLKQPKQSQPKRQTQAPPWGKAKAGDG